MNNTTPRKGRSCSDVSGTRRSATATGTSSPSTAPAAASSRSTRSKATCTTTSPTPKPQQAQQHQAQQHQPLDFIGSSHAVKDLFSLPYAVDRPISVALHNLAGTLLIDADHDCLYEQGEGNNDDHKDNANDGESGDTSNARRHQQPQPQQQKPPRRRSRPSSLPSISKEETSTNNKEEHQVSNALVALSSLELVDSGSEALTIVNSLIESSRRERISISTSTTNSAEQHAAGVGVHKEEQDKPPLPPPEEYVYPFVPPVPEPREYLNWRFHDMSLLVGSNAIIYRSPPSTPDNNNTVSSSSSSTSTTNTSTTTTESDDGPSTSSTANTSTALTIRVEDVGYMKALLTRHEELKGSGQFLPDHEHNAMQQIGKPSYVEVTTRRNFLPSSDPCTLAPPSSSSSTTSTTALAANDDDKTTSTSASASCRNESFSAPDLAQVRLQTCIVPAPTSPIGGGFLSRGIPGGGGGGRAFSSNSMEQQEDTPNRNPAAPLSPVSTVLDIYLDNIMANVPQLALCLQEKGFVQSVKLLQTDDIPSRLLSSRTLDTTTPFDVISSTTTTSGSSTSSSSSSNACSSSAMDTEKIFSPQIMETNASTLLRFLKANCSRDNATYLLRREAGQTNIQLYDITTISTQRQRKWIWWLAMMSYRFASRLRTLSSASQSSTGTATGSCAAFNNDAIFRRNCRARQRSLLQNTLDLLEVLSDMDDDGGSNKHESLVSAVCENLADTFLALSEQKDKDEASQQQHDHSKEHSNATTTTSQAQQASSSSSAPPPPATSVALSKQPYGSLSTDSLNKAQDHLKQAIRGLEPVLQSLVTESTRAIAATTAKGTGSRQACGRRKARLLPSQVPVVSVVDNDSSSASGSDTEGYSNRDVAEGDIDVTNAAAAGTTTTTTATTSLSARRRQHISLVLLRRLEPVVTQLFGLYHKLVNVSLRLAEIHLRNYYSSSAMQALRISARTIAASLYLVQLLEEDQDQKRLQDWLARIQLQYTWLWEHCGHFARSYAADELWRDRGHASGDDIISVLQDAEAAFANYTGLNVNDPILRSRFIQPENPLMTKSNNLVNLHALSGVVDFDVPNSQVPLGSKGSSNCKSLGVSASSKGHDMLSLEAARTVLNQHRLILRDKRKVLIAASLAYYRAIQSFRQGITPPEVDSGTFLSSSHDVALLRLLQQRLGDACNETGKILLNEVRVLLTAGGGNNNSNKGEPNNSHGIKLQGDELHRVAEVLLSSSQFWFMEGLAAFEECKDLRNLALLRCNLCQSYKFRANAMFAPHTPTGVTTPQQQQQQPTHAELCLQIAANHLQAAHESLGERDVDPVTWDMVSEELGATLLVLGVRRRQSLLQVIMGRDSAGGAIMSSAMILQAFRLSPGQEHLIVDPMERALAIYRQLGNYHQAAASHYQLALYYSKIWTCQINENKTREKLAAALEHYKAAYQYFSRSVRGNEVTFCLLSIDLCSLYLAVSGKESTKNAFVVCLRSVDAFSPDVIDLALSDLSSTSSSRRIEWFRQMETLASSLEECVFKCLRTLVKLEDEEKSDSVDGVRDKNVSFKELYRTGLLTKMSAAAATTTSTTASTTSTAAATDNNISHLGADNDDEMTTCTKIAAKLRTLHSILYQLQAAGANRFL